MSLGIDVDEVVAVLLADGWHDVHERSFTLDAYEYLRWFEHDELRQDPTVLHGGGQRGITAAGFQFNVGENTRISGPLSAVLAVRTVRGDESAVG